MTKDILKSTLPVLFGYIPLGMAFGILFQDLGYPWYLATLMALFVYAGAAQFMIIGLLIAGAGLTEVVVSTFLINSRHMFYGLSMLTQYGHWGLGKVYLAFGLTDETYSLLTTVNPKDASKKRQYFLMVTMFNHSYWIIGCTLGALLGSAIEFNTQGLEFTLTALFIVLVIEQWKKIQELTPFVIALIAAGVALLVSSEQMLLTSIVLSVALLITNHIGRPS